MEPGDEQERAAAALGHPVTLVVPREPGRPLIAGSVAGDPPRGRAAWIGADGRVLARIAVPGGRPSRARPVVATAITVDLGDGTEDQVVVALLAREAAAVRVQVAGDEGEGPAPVAAADGLALVRIPVGAFALALDALDPRGEPIGRLARAGIGEMWLQGGQLAGRLGATHGMSAGIGAGRWVRDLDEAALEAGFRPLVPGWIPPGLEAGPPRIEPEPAYPTAPPAVVTVWRGEGDARVLLRQTAAPLARPELPGPRARTVDVNGVPGVLRARGIALVVWERPDRAFGLQVRGIPDGVETALRIARSVPAVPGPGADDAAR